MTGLLYNSISSGLTEDEITEIDKRVSKNLEVVHLFLRKLPSNSKRKAKRVWLYAMFLFQLGQPLVPYTAAVVMPLPPAVHKLSSIEQGRILGNKNCYPQIATLPALKVDKIRLTNDKIEEFNNLAIQLNNGLIKMDEAILQIRGGSGLTDVAAVIAFILFMNCFDMSI